MKTENACVFCHGVLPIFWWIIVIYIVISFLYPLNQHIWFAYFIKVLQTFLAKKSGDFWRQKISRTFLTISSPRNWNLFLAYISGARNWQLLAISVARNWHFLKMLAGHASSSWLSELGAGVPYNRERRIKVYISPPPHSTHA